MYITHYVRFIKGILELLLDDGFLCTVLSTLCSNLEHTVGYFFVVGGGGGREGREVILWVGGM